MRLHFPLAMSLCKVHSKSVRENHSPSASSAFNSRNFSSTGGGKEDSGGSAILVGRDCSKGSEIKRKKFTTSSGRGNSCSTVFTCSTLERSSEEYARESRDKFWQATQRSTGLQLHFLHGKIIWPCSLLSFQFLEFWSK